MSNTLDSPSLPLLSRASGETLIDQIVRSLAARIDDKLLRGGARMPSIRRLILFGSLASGSATPRSDADILAIVDSSPHVAARPRVPDLLAAMSPVPGPVDPLVLTQAEFDRAQTDGTPLVREAAKGIDLLS